MNQLKKIRILSRKSDLALIQAYLVGSKIQEKFSNIQIEYISKKTTGDIDLKTPLSEMENLLTQLVAIDKLVKNVKN